MKRPSRGVAAIALACAVTIAAAEPAFAGSDLQQQQQQLSHQRAALQVQIDLAKATDTKVEAEANRLDAAYADQVRVVQAERGALVAVQARVAASQARLDEIDHQSSAARASLVARAVELYEHPFESEAAIIVGAQSLSDYAERQALVTAVQGRTSDLIDAFRQQHLDEVAASKNLRDLEAAAAQQATLTQNEELLLERAKISVDASHAALQRRIAAMQAESNILAAQESQVEAKLAAAEALYPVSPVAYTGRFIWPLHGVVTQEFGRQSGGGFHPGVDIAAPYGTAIHASAGGTVIYAGWESGYGNYTCINHGGGIATCYAHQSAIGVSVGQSVRQGEVIGAEGSTGYSTGPHVHFEVRVNGTPVNPRSYVPGNP